MSLHTRRIFAFGEYLRVLRDRLKSQQFEVVDLSFTTFRHDLALVIYDFAELGNRKNLKYERLLTLIGKLFDQFNERLVLLIKSSCSDFPELET